MLPSIILGQPVAARASGVMFQSAVMIHGPLMARVAATSSCMRVKFSPTGPRPSLAYALKTWIPPFTTPLIHAWPMRWRTLLSITGDPRSLMPVPFLAQMAQPPDAFSASVFRACTSVVFHPRVLACLLASLTFSSPATLVSCRPMMSAVDTLSILSLAVVQELGLTLSTAHQPCLTHHLSASMSPSWLM